RPRLARDRISDLGIDDRPAVPVVEPGQPRAVMHAAHRLDGESRFLEQPGQLGGVEFAGVERVERCVAPGGEGDAVGGADDQAAAGLEYTVAFAEELRLVPQVLYDLQVDDHADRRVTGRQGCEVAAHGRDRRVAGRHVLDGGRVVV